MGCSSGYLLEKLAVNFPNDFTIGADTIREPLYKLSKRLTAVPLIRLDLLKNPFKKPFVDVITLLNVAEHIKDDTKAFVECFKMLNPKGILIVELPAFQFLYDSYDKNLKHYRRYNLKDLENKLKKIGYVIKFKTYESFFLFPIYFIVKIMNKIFKNKKNVVVSQSKMSNNFITKILLKIEEKFFKNMYLPFGIRCFICVQKI